MHEIATLIPYHPSTHRTSCGRKGNTSIDFGPPLKRRMPTDSVMATKLLHYAMIRCRTLNVEDQVFSSRNQNMRRGGGILKDKIITAIPQHIQDHPKYSSPLQTLRSMDNQILLQPLVPMCGKEGREAIPRNNGFPDLTLSGTIMKNMHYGLILIAIESATSVQSHAFSAYYQSTRCLKPPFRELHGMRFGPSHVQTVVKRGEDGQSRQSPRDVHICSFQREGSIIRVCPSYTVNPPPEKGNEGSEL